MGYSRQEVIGRKCYQIFQKEQHHCHLAETRCPFKQSILERQVVHEVRSRVDHSGARRYIDVSVYPIWERGGKVSKFIEVSRDITARKLEEDEITRRLEHMVEERTRQLKETHEKLLHQDKMASLGKLAASVVHEINNPIAGILNLIAIEKRILGQGSPTEERLDRFREHLDLMETETRRISRIVSNLLSFSRQNRFELKPVDLNRVLEKSLFLSSNLMKLNRVKIETHLDPRLPPVLASEDQMQQVFMNLISNALEAMENSEGGLLTIVSQYPSNNGNVRIGLRDTGVGIPPENIPRLFEPFFTTKKKGKGVGLGLSVVYGIIQAHGGSIRAESEPGKGTLMEMELPVGDKPQPLRSNGDAHERH
jgi:PAS domain S-box-containing protein